MTHSRSYTSATRSNSLATAHHPVSTYSTNGWRTAWFAIFLLGIALRLLRLTWQPLWWDEGYSIYFATEPLPTMLSLTARDIHPPLYYALLHLWLTLTGSTGPEAARLFSVLTGIVTLPVMTWLARSLWPMRPSLALIATFLLAVNPIHIFYSQEIRMYGLALLLTLAASTYFWRMEKESAHGGKPYGSMAGYVLTASLALLTLYYTGFILLAHQLWALYVHRHSWQRWRWFLLAALLILLIQLPWWLYALPKLLPYVADKVIADQDSALPLWSYLWRHWLAFFTGHIPAANAPLELARQLMPALVALSLLLAISIVKWRPDRHPLGWLLCLILTPLFVGFAVNLLFPFFPEGGERLLLQILPYLIAGLAFVSGSLLDNRRAIGGPLLALPLVAATIGGVIFFTTPRYVEHDYRPLIDNVFTNSRSNDSVLAIFPWQVGYWRAYSPRTADGALLPPQPAPVDQTILTWNNAFAAQLDADLANGTIWFPMPLSFGSTLPTQIEEYLQARSRNLENHWYSPATRLSAWVQLVDQPEPSPVTAIYPEAASAEQPEVRLDSAGIAPSTVPSANTPLAVDLCWQPPSARDDLRATLRLLDASGYPWATRDLTPLAAYAGDDPANPCLEAIAFNVPAGLPPGSYHLALGVGQKQSDQLFNPTTPSAETASPLITLGQINVTTPSQPLSPQRLPIEHWLSTPLADDGLQLLGYSGPEEEAAILAGDEVAVTLFLHNTSPQPPTRNLYISLLDSAGNGVDGWEGWPLPHYTTDSWAEGALAQVPVRFFLRSDLEEGSYTLSAGFLNAATGDKSSPVSLMHIKVIRRAASFTPPTGASPLIPPVQFGTHARLVGYSVIQNGTTLHLTLTWEILQPLLPPHHIFVHLFDASGQRIAQDDGDPMTLDGRAPTGSWLPGEYLSTQHILMLPENPQAPLTLMTGLYLPATGDRLPATADGAAIGDSATISIPTTP
ncbi:MAG: glycosyltransferase family 39 protein [Caldilineaceae bacterium]|nr:glycosyltransferase family 39 protein [Caldilineaceae bacterium]